ncbi:hypothetical protein FisN_23Hu117 [Fistulifera solaris]|uniref:Uncharacterized protein n=1 Tax=Fistulifera solaris TaxID=1519565 RepID=A0A1Z5KMB1_FISSO|nr:hypothetical protein FisN_23Hu117 [Fistulifera solaris]|eukprot:GAX27419.1 hypothetical protein FisN_23Hu117 [Fistulifera solaris]
MGRGQLVFKGEATKKAKKKVKHDRKQDADVVGAAVVKNPLPKYEPGVAKAKNGSSVPPPTIEDGIGQITSSGTVIMGHGTSFMNTLSVGDAILVQIDENSPPEMRVITMCLSNTSINLSSSFSRSLTTPTSFQYIRKPKVSGQSRAAKTKLEQDDHERASGFQGSNVLVYRESTETGSYRIKKETVAGDVSRTHLLEMRAKKKSDKYC